MYVLQSNPAANGRALKNDLKTQLKNVDTVIGYIGTIFKIRVDVIEHEAHGGVKIPVQADGNIIFFTTFNQFVRQIQSGVTKPQLKGAPSWFANVKITFRLDPVKNSFFWL